MTQKRKVWFHRLSAFAWVIIGTISFVLGWQESVVLVWIASVYANIKSDWAAAEAADHRDVTRRLDRIESLIREKPGD